MSEFKVQKDSPRPWGMRDRKFNGIFRVKGCKCRDENSVFRLVGKLLGNLPVGREASRRIVTV